MYVNTGFKDSEGTEIYENDWLVWAAETKGGVVEDWNGVWRANGIAVATLLAEVDDLIDVGCDDDFVEEANTCWNCDEPCSLYSEYQDDGRTFCSLDCLNEATNPDETND
jgi:hypothetical protein